MARATRLKPPLVGIIPYLLAIGLVMTIQPLFVNAQTTMPSLPLAAIYVPLATSTNGLRHYSPLTVATVQGLQTRYLLVDTATRHILVYNTTVCDAIGRTDCMSGLPLETSPTSSGWSTQIEGGFQVSCSGCRDAPAVIALSSVGVALSNQQKLAAQSTITIASKMTLFDPGSLPTMIDFNGTYGFLGLVQGSTFWTSFDSQLASTTAPLTTSQIHFGLDLHRPPLSLTHPVLQDKSLYPYPYNAMSDIHNLTRGQGGQGQILTAAQAMIDTGSKMYLGGVPAQYASSLVVARNGATLGQTFYTFSMNNVQVCGITLSKAINNLIIDTAAACLSLPSSVFSALMSWLPVTCVASTRVRSPSTICYYNYTGPEDVPPTLPTLSFTVSPPSSEQPNPQQLHIPLASLLVPVHPANTTTTSSSSSSSTSYEKGYRRLYSLCIVPVPNANSSLGFGTLPLSALYAHFTPSSTPSTVSVYLANKASITHSTAQCNAPARCIGMQYLDTSKNTCVDPKCDAYFFLSLDKTTGQCTLSTSFYAVAITIIAIGILGELGIATVQATMSNIITRTAPRYLAAKPPHQLRYRSRVLEVDV